MIRPSWLSIGAPVAGLVLLAVLAAVTPRQPEAARDAPGVTLLAEVRGDRMGQYQDPLAAHEGYADVPMEHGLPGGLGLWVTAGAPLGTGEVHATAQGPDGETLLVQVTREYLTPLPRRSSRPRRFPRSTPSFGEPPRDMPPVPSAPALPPRYLLILPGDYPTGYGPVEVTVTDDGGHTARLLVTHLLPSFHASPGHPALQDTLHVDGVTLTASAQANLQRQLASGFFTNTPGQRGIEYQIEAAIPPGTEYGVFLSRALPEWTGLPPAPVPLATVGYTYPAIFNAPFGRRGTAYSAADLMANQSLQPRRGWVRTEFARYDHYLRLDGELVRFASVEETVTFHNLTIRACPGSVPGAPSYAIDTQPQTVVTPSGIFVSLLPLPNYDHLPGGRTDGGPPLIQMRLKISPLAMNGARWSNYLAPLPHSPLSGQSPGRTLFSVRAARFNMSLWMLPIDDPADPRTFGDPFLTTLAISPADPSGNRLLPANGPETPPKFLPTLTLVVTQEAEVKATPIQFVLPLTQ